MGNPTPKPSSAATVLPLVVTGFGIGWLAGLSVSPVISIVITSVTGTVATLIAALSGAKDELLNADIAPATARRWLRSVTPAPLAWLVIGLLVGSSTGIWVRSHNLLSPATTPINLSAEVAEWVKLGLGQDEVVRRLFESRVAANNAAQSTAANPTTTTHDSVLFASASPDQCTVWLDYIDDGKFTDLETELRSGKLPFRELPNIVTEPTKLAELIKQVICAPNPS